MSKKLSITLVEAKNLIACDVGKTSDPYVKVEHNGKSHLTKHISGTLAPVWNETIELDYNPQYKVTLTVLDHDLIGADDFMGQVELWQGKIAEHPDAWLPLKPKNAEDDEEVVTGEIHIKIK